MKRLAWLVLLALVIGTLSGCFLLKPTAPLLKLESVTEHSVTLSWTESSQVDGFKIYRREDGTFDLIAQVGSGVRSYTDENLTEDTEYAYKMAAYKFGVLSDQSNVLNVKTAYGISGKVVSVGGAPLSNVSVFVNGTQKAITNEMGKWNITDLTGTVTLSVKKENWVFDPKSRKVSHSQANINFVGTRVPSIPHSPNPPNLASGVATSVILSWSCEGSLLNYDVYFGTTPQNMKKVAININSPTYHLSNLRYATEYFWKVLARNSVGSASGPVWEFTTVPTPVSLAGRVTDTNGNGLRDVKINFNNGYASVYTDFNGYWHKNGMTAPVTVTPFKYRWCFTPSSTVVSSSKNDVNFVGTYVDHAPFPPSNPFPSDGAINIATSVTLKWSDSDPDGDTLTYDLYLGTSPTPPLKVSNLTAPSYTVNLLPSTTYYWKVVASDGIKTSSGPVWSFKTQTFTPSGTGTVTGKVDVYTGKSAFISSASCAPEKNTFKTVELQKVSERGYVPHEVIVSFEKQASVANFKSVPFHYEVVSTLKAGNGAINVSLIRVANVKNAIKYFKSLPYVKYAEPNYISYALDVPNDTYYSYQWNLPDINMPQAWQLTKGDNTVIVAVLDTGVSSTHPDLQSVLVTGYNFVSDDTNTNDDFGHGTHVAGIIDADTNNAMGVAGVDWGEANSIKIMPVKVLNSAGKGSDYCIAQGIVYAVTHGAKVINMSLGGSDYSSIEEEACAFAYNNGVVLVAAAGNEDQSTLDYPAAFSTVIPVSAVGPDNERASYSNYSSNVLWAPGGDYTNSNQNMILSTYYATSTQENTYAYMEGTSMAAPHVSAVIALMISRGITGPANIWNILENTAQSVLASQNYGGYGLINAYSAITYNGGWEPMIVYAENESNSDVYPTYVKADGYFSLTLPAGTYKIYAWQDFNSDNIIDTGDFYGYIGYYGNSSDSPLNVNVADGSTVNYHIYVSPKIDNSSNPFTYDLGYEKLIEFKKRLVKDHYKHMHYER